MLPSKSKPRPQVDTFTLLLKLRQWLSFRLLEGDYVNEPSLPPGELTLEESMRDRYPDLITVLRRIAGEADLPEGPIERLEVSTHADGSSTYRVWPARAEEPDGGYLPAEGT